MNKYKLLTYKSMSSVPTIYKLSKCQDEEKEEKD
jgi:hypothetical protein